jgi:hypothetical protein
MINFTNATSWEKELETITLHPHFEKLRVAKLIPPFFFALDLN